MPRFTLGRVVIVSAAFLPDVSDVRVLPVVLGFVLFVLFGAAFVAYDPALAFAVAFIALFFREIFRFESDATRTP